MSLIERRDQSYCKERSKLLPWPTLRKSILIIQLVLLLTQLGRWANRQDFLLAFNRSPTRLCPQTKDLLPIENLDIWSEVGQTLKSPEFRQRAVDYLGGAVRVPCATVPVLYHLPLSSRTHGISGLNRTTKWVPLVSTHDGMCLAHFTNTFQRRFL